MSSKPPGWKPQYESQNRGPGTRQRPERYYIMRDAQLAEMNSRGPGWNNGTNDAYNEAQANLQEVMDYWGSRGNNGNTNNFRNFDRPSRAFRRGLSEKQERSLRRQHYHHRMRNSGEFEAQIAEANARGPGWNSNEGNPEHQEALRNLEEIRGGQRGTKPRRPVMPESPAMPESTEDSPRGPGSRPEDRDIPHVSEYTGIHYRPSPGYDGRPIPKPGPNSGGGGRPRRGTRGMRGMRGGRFSGGQGKPGNPRRANEGISREVSRRRRIRSRRRGGRR